MTPLVWLSGSQSGLRSLLTPTAGQTLLLKSVLLQGDACRKAWRDWLSLGANHLERLSGERAGTRRLIPLLHSNLVANQVEVEPELLTVMRSATLRESRRMDVYVAILRRVLEALAAAKVEAVVLKGAALAGTAYANWGLRHCHDIDLWLGDEDVPRAHAALQGAGFLADGEVGGRSNCDTILRHESGMPVILHRRLFALPLYNPAKEAAREATLTAASDPPMSVLEPAHLLVHVLGHSSYSSSRGTLQWACDAVLLARHQPNIDWQLVEDFARECRLALPLAVLLDYLARELELPVPPELVQRMRAEAGKAGPEARGMAFGGAFASRTQPLTALLKEGDWSTRAAVLRWMFLPPAQYLRWTRPVAHDWLLPYYYVERPISYLAALVRRRTDARRSSEATSSD